MKNNNPNSESKRNKNVNKAPSLSGVAVENMSIRKP
jgi:hypothetical protein